MPSFRNIFLFYEDSPMLFTQLFFWVFFAIVLTVYSVLYKKKTVRNAYLFLISLFFYYKSGGFYFFLLIFSTLADYYLGHKINNSQIKKNKKLFLTLSVMINLGVLGYFKYSEFFTGIINSVFSLNLEAVNYFALIGNTISGKNFDIGTIILPVGISFFTFQTISYTVDVYRGKVKPVKSLIDFGFYVSFFPQLVAGPIVRAASFIPQLYEDYKLSKEQMGHAIFLIISGLIKKIIISNYIALNFIDRIFDNPASFSGFENLTAVYGYSIQIYCDFSGYTDIAIGVALLFGFKLPINFNSPYKANNLTDFWRRWHISLSSWLRDYLYIPLGGGRKGNIRMLINVMVTMVLGGLWHGANFRFLIWGFIHGLGLILQKLWNLAFPGNEKRKKLKKFLFAFLTFQFVSLSWIFFRAENIGDTGIIFNQIFNHFSFSHIPEMVWAYRSVFLIIFIGFSFHWLPVAWKEKYRGWFIEQSFFSKVFIVVLVVFLLYQFKTSQLQPFIYFQF